MVSRTYLTTTPPPPQQKMNYAREKQWYIQITVDASKKDQENAIYFAFHNQCQ